MVPECKDGPTNAIALSRMFYCVLSSPRHAMHEAKETRWCLQTTWP